jgi:hypothetical protein
MFLDTLSTWEAVQIMTIDIKHPFPTTTSVFSSNIILIAVLKKN